MPGIRDNEPPAIEIAVDEGTIRAANEALCRLTGYERAELVGSPFEALVPPEWLAFVVRRLRVTAGSSPAVTSHECVIVDRRGARIPVEFTATLMDETAAGPPHVRAMIRDMRAPVELESRLQESEDRFRGAFEGAAIGMAMVSTDGRWLRVNRSLSALLGYSSDELLDLTFQDLTHPDDLNRDLELMHQVLDGEIAWYHMEKRYIRKDGQEIWGMLAVSLVRSADGRPAYFVSQISDISARKQFELAVAGAPPTLDPKARMLSPRETQVLALLAEGHLTSEAGDLLGIAEDTVQTLVRRAMRKLGTRNRTHAVVTALRLGLL